MATTYYVDVLFVAASIELGHASDTTLARTAAGKIAVEGKAVPLMDSTFDVVIAGPTAARTYTFPDADSTIVTLAAVQIISGLKTFAPSKLGLQDTDATHALFINCGSNLTADRTLTITTGDVGNHTFDISGVVAESLLYGTGTRAVGTFTMGAGIRTFMTSPTSANFASAVTGETGTAGGVVFSVNPTIESLQIAVDIRWDRVDPASITADVNDWDPEAAATGNYFRSTNDGAAHNVTGMVAGAASEERWLLNIGSGTITIPHQSASSAAANRWATSTSASLSWTTGRWLHAVYDGSSAVWRVALIGA